MKRQLAAKQMLIPMLPEVEQFHVNSKIARTVPWKVERPRNRKSLYHSSVPTNGPFDPLDSQRKFRQTQKIGGDAMSGDITPEARKKQITERRKNSMGVAGLQRYNRMRQGKAQDMRYMLDSRKPGEKLADALFAGPPAKETLEEFAAGAKGAKRGSVPATSFNFSEPRSSVDQGPQSTRAPGTAPYQPVSAIDKTSGQRQSMPIPRTYKDVRATGPQVQRSEGLVSGIGDRMSFSGSRGADPTDMAPKLVNPGQHFNMELRVQNHPSSLSRKSHGQKRGVAYLNKHRNYVDDEGTEVGSHVLALVDKPLASDYGVPQNAKRDILQMYKPVVTPEEETSQVAKLKASHIRETLKKVSCHFHVTGTSHNKYKRTRDGDWGFKGPLRDNELVVDFATMEDERQHYFEIRNPALTRNRLVQRHNRFAMSLDNGRNVILPNKVFESIGEDQMLLQATRAQALIQDSIRSEKEESVILAQTAPHSPGKDALDMHSEEPTIKEMQHLSSMSGGGHIIPMNERTETLRRFLPNRGKQSSMPLDDAHLNVYNSNAPPLIQQDQTGLIESTESQNPELHRRSTLMNQGENQEALDIVNDVTSDAKKSLESRPKSKGMHMFDPELPVGPRQEATLKRNIDMQGTNKPFTPNVDMAAKTLTEETEFHALKTRPMASKPAFINEAVTSHGYGSRSSSDAMRQTQNDAIINAQMRLGNKLPIEKMVIEQADAQKNRNVVYQYLDSEKTGEGPAQQQTILADKIADKHVSGESRLYATADSYVKPRTQGSADPRMHQDGSFTRTDDVYWRPSVYSGNVPMSHASKRTLNQKQFDFPPQHPGLAQPGKSLDHPTTMSTIKEEDAQPSARQTLQQIRKTTIGFMKLKKGSLDADQFEAKKDAYLLSHYAGQNMVDASEANRKLRLKIQHQIEEVAEAIRDRKKTINTQRLNMQRASEETTKNIETYVKLNQIGHEIENDANFPVSSLYGGRLFEDFQISKDQVKAQVEEHTARVPRLKDEATHLREENQRIRKMILRYKQMNRDIELGKMNVLDASNRKTGLVGDSIHQNSPNPFDGKRQSQKTSIDTSQHSEVKVSEGSPITGKITPFRPLPHSRKTRLTAGGVTNMTFGFQGRQILDQKRIENINIGLPQFFKIKNSVDSITNLLGLLQKNLKTTTQSITMFIIDKDLITKVIANNDKTQFFRHFPLGSKEIVGISTLPQLIQRPYFDDLDHLLTTKTPLGCMLVPLGGTAARPQIVLQVQADISKMTTKQRQTLVSMRITNDLVRGMTTTEKSSQHERSKSFEDDDKSRHTKTTTTQGSFNQIDILVIRMLGQILLLNLFYFRYRTEQRQKQETQGKVLGFAVDVMSCRYYRDIIRTMNHHCKPLLGFEKATIFFKDSTSTNLFTVTAIQKRKKDTNGGKLPDTSFAHELCFPSDEIVVLPSELGMTGEVLRKNAIQVQNNFGELISADNKDGLDASNTTLHHDPSELATPLLAETSVSVKARNGGRESLSVTPNAAALQMSVPLSTSYGKHQNKQLEQIIEDPNIESEMHLQSPHNRKTPLRARRAATKPLDEQTPMKLHAIISGTTPLSGDPHAEIDPSPTLSGQGLVNDREVSESSVSKPTPRDGSATAERVKMPAMVDPNDPERTQQPIYGQKGDISAATSLNDRERSVGNIRSAEKHETGRQGDIMNLRTSKLKKPSEEPAVLTAEFLNTIDNFSGIKNIENFILVSLRDKMYEFLPEEAVGVLQLQNKADGSQVNREDVARVQCYSRFIGAMTMRAQIVTCLANELIKVMEDVKMPKSVSTDFYSGPSGYKFAEGQGPMSTLLVDTELLEKGFTEIAQNTEQVHKKFSLEEEVARGFEEAKELKEKKDGGKEKAPEKKPDLSKFFKVLGDEDGSEAEDKQA